MSSQPLATKPAPVVVIGQYDGCFHCGEPSPGHSFTKAEKVFCCQGCLVVHDLLGLYDRKTPKFVKKYADIGSEIVKAVGQFKDEVKTGIFPADEQVFH